MPGPIGKQIIFKYKRKYKYFGTQIYVSQIGNTPVLANKSMSDLSLLQIMPLLKALDRNYIKNWNLSTWVKFKMKAKN